ncbi:YfiR family protein [Desulfococcaceae bacterium HSG8]|nr:YfiR family protein [Desulfococcaceae bacterium HSG8]
MDITKQTLSVILMLLTTSFILASAAISGSFSKDIPENEIKAALIFKFPVYVRWPDSVMNDKTGNFECCVLGNDPVSSLLTQFNGKKMMEQTIRIRQLSNIREIDDCHMLFISSPEKKNLLMIFKAIKGKPILTVGHMKKFTQNGGIINFIRQEDSVRFEINPKAAEQAGLKISSKLLRLAEIVK